jgi:hypothetical protein
MKQTKPATARMARSSLLISVLGHRRPSAKQSSDRMAKPVTIHVTVPQLAPDREAAIAELDRSLASVRGLTFRLASYLGAAFAEICVNHIGGRSLTVLVNGTNAWLMCLRYDGDAGFSSRNPDYAGEVNATTEYLLSNGQMDEYPTSWAYPTPRVLDVVAAFARHEHMPAWVEWHNDSGDGAKSPDEPHSKGA